MVTLDQTVKQGIKTLEKSADKKIRIAIKNDTLRMWKGRKVIPLSKWEKIESDLKIVFDYIPDGFIDEYSMIYNWRLGEKFDKARAAWLEDYHSYLEFKKNSDYGKYMCSNCILNPSPKAKTTSIRDILVKHFLDSEISFPCEVVNIFECPYKQGKEDNALFYLGYLWKIVDDALNYAYNKTNYDNKKFIEVDFEKNIARHYYSWSPDQFSFGPIAQEIGDLRLSQVPIEEIKDIYAVLTNHEKLDLLLEQYIEAIADDYLYSGKRNERSERQAAQTRKAKNTIIHLLMQIKNKIKLEDLRSLYDETLEDEEKERQDKAERRKFIAKLNQEKTTSEYITIRSGTCISCDGFANIHCVNCDVWICDKHWKEHGISKHSMTFET